MGCGISMSDDGYGRAYRGKDPYGRGGSPKGPSEYGRGQGHAGDDPLTELARLIGQGDQSEPQPDWRAPPPVNYDGYQYPAAQSPDPRYAGYPPADPYAGHGGPDPQYGQQQPFDAQPYGGQPYGEQPYQGDAYRPGGYDPMMYPQAAAQQDEYQGGPYFGNGRHDRDPDDDFDDRSSSGGRSGFFTIVAVLCLAVVGTAGAFAYRSLFAGDGQARVILADPNPKKIVSAAVDNFSQSAPDRPDPGQSERVVSHEERPLNPQGMAAASPRIVFPGDNGPPPIPNNATALAPVNPPTASSDPKRVRTLTIKPEQPPDPFAQAQSARVASAGGLPTGSTSATRSAGPRSNAPPPPAPAEAGDPPLQLVPQGAAPADPPTASLASVGSRPARVAPTPSAAAVAAGNFFVQVSAQRSEEDAQTTFRAVQTKYPSQLGGRELVVRKKDLAEKGTFYGVQVGPFASRDEAVKLCESLKSAGGACMIDTH